MPSARSSDHVQGHQVMCKVIRPRARSSGHVQGHQATCKVIGRVQVLEGRPCTFIEGRVSCPRKKPHGGHAQRRRPVSENRRGQERGQNATCYRLGRSSLSQLQEPFRRQSPP
jgi:hypothetical protein